MIYIVIIILIILSLALLAGRYFVVVPKRKKITINKGNDNLTILFFSDLHLGAQLKKKTLAKIIRRLYQPADVVIFGGDLVGKQLFSYYNLEQIKELFAPFSNIKYRFFIMGNHEKKIAFPQVEQVVAAIGFTLLVNDVVTINKNNTAIRICGLDEMLKGNPVLHQADIYLIHQPDYFVYINNGLTLSGHSHGGQITLFKKRIYKAKFSRFYQTGLYQSGVKQLIVSNGIGTNFIPLRFFARSDYYLINYRFDSNQGDKI